MRRAITFALVPLILLVCGGRKQPEGPRTVRFWQFWSSQEARAAWDTILAEFTEENPGYRVELSYLTWAEGHDKIMVAMSSGSPPDLVELGSDWVAGFAASGALASVTDSARPLVSEYQAWEPVVFGDSVVGLPWLVDTRCLFVNKNLLHFAGMNENDTSYTWAEFSRAVARVDSVAADVYGFGANAAERHRLYKKVLPFFWAAGGDVFDQDGELTIDGPTNVEALSYYVSLIPNSVIGTQSELDDAFCAGRVGFVISGSWLITKLDAMQDPPLYSVLLMPRPDTNRGSPASFFGGEYLSIPRAAAEPIGAWKLARFLVRPDVASTLAGATGVTFPAAKAASGGSFYRDDPRRAVFMEQMKFARPSPVHPRWVELEAILEESVEEAMYKRRTPADALRECAARMRKILSEPPPA